MTEQVPSNESFKQADELVIHTEARVLVSPTFNRLRARVQGQVLFIGDYWLMIDEARELRDWLNKVLP